MTQTGYCPIYGCEILADPDAQPYHHHWLIVDQNGQVLDADQSPKLKEIQLSLSFGYLVIKGEGMLRMDIPLDVIEDDESVMDEIHVGMRRLRIIDEGDLAAAWISNFLGVQGRLVKVHPDEAPL
ncbi:MAG: hypothetical protein CML16_01125 [Pusillimonas sp.]|nr:hypothetical protein [Pusillimonas sp.]MBC40970.1 hypothetical protein [Pusillimonas sp.]HCP77966.1 hypothetical protein [Pusillimonas sp.]|tara:strand:- start:112 stop:486 length:375 start_codon:yes stop_codon:yes gene_type:complete